MQTGAEFDYHNILTDGLDREQLESLARTAGSGVAGLINPRSRAFRVLKVETSDLSDDRAADIIIDNPRVMYRPILTDGNRIVIGFKPDQMRALLT